MCEERKIFLVGIGMGTESGMTEQAQRLVLDCSCLIGAGRMLECAKALLGGIQEEKLFVEEYRTEEIVRFIEDHPKIHRIAVLFSGDTGFYSGARRLSEKLREKKICAKLAPGVSSAAYLAARCGVSWEDAAFVSLHGRKEDFIQAISRNRRTFLLLGDKESAAFMLGRLREYEMDDVSVYAGANLSRQDERMISGSPSGLKESDLEGLCTVLIENPFPDQRACPHIRDGEFIRGKIPMTKEEVRAVSLARLELLGDSVLWDVGAGTGSVSVEAALSATGIRVWAVEKNPQAAELIRKNRKKFKTDNIRVIEGTAPDVLWDLEAPTHVFVGGSSGSLKEIIKAARARNPEVKMVFTAVSLETVRDIMEAADEGLVPTPEVTQISAARARKLGGHHLMTGMNPVYIISAGGRKER